MTTAILIAAIIATVILWATTRTRAHQASYLQGHNAGYVTGHTAGYRKAYAEQDLLVDELQAEIGHLEERNADLSKQMEAAA